MIVVKNLVVLLLVRMLLLTGVLLGICLSMLTHESVKVRQTERRKGRHGQKERQTIGKRAR